MSYGNSGNGVIGVGGLRGESVPSYPQASAQQRETISAALDTQQNTIGQLHAVISDLESRLNSVVESRPQDPTNSVMPPPAPTPTQVLYRVNDNSRSIDGAVKRIVELVQRIQL